MADVMSLLFKINADSSDAQKEMSKLRTVIKSEAQSIVSALPGGGALSAFTNEISQASAVTKTGFNEIAGGAGGVKGALAGMTTAAAGAVAGIVTIGTAAVGIVTGLYALAKGAADATGKFIDLRQATGFSVETLSALDNAAQTSGGSLGSITGALGIFEKNMESAAQGNKKLSAAFQQLNIDTSDNEKALRQAFVALAKMPEGAQQTAVAMALFGRSGKDVLSVIKETGGSLDGAIAKYRQLGTLISTDVAEAGDKASDTFKVVERQLAAVKTQIGMELAPTFLKFAEDFSRFLSENPTAVKEWGGILSVVVKDIVGSFEEIAGWIKEINDFLNWASGYDPKTAPDASLDPYGPGGKARGGKPPGVPKDFDPQTRTFMKPATAPRLNLDFSPDKAKQPKETDEDRLQQKLTELIAKVQQARAEYRQLANAVKEGKVTFDDGSKSTEKNRAELDLLSKGLADATAATKAQYVAQAAQLDKQNALAESARKQLQAYKDAYNELTGYLRNQQQELRVLVQGEDTAIGKFYELIDSLKATGGVLVDPNGPLYQMNLLNAVLLDMAKNVGNIDLSKLNLGTVFGDSGALVPPTGTGDAFNDFILNTTPPPPPDFSQWHVALGALKDAGKDALGGLSQGMGNVVQSFLLGEKVTGKAMMAMAKGVIAGVAAQAAVQAIYELAMGLASLWLNPAKAATHFLAAKTFGLVAAVAGGISLAIPGGGSGIAAGTSLQQNNNRGNATGSNSNDPRLIEVNRTGGETQRIVIEHRVTMNPNEEKFARFAVDSMVKDYRGNGDTRHVIVNDGMLASA